MAKQKQAEEQYCIEQLKVRYGEDEISKSQIASDLNACEVPTKPGGTLSHKQVPRIITRVNNDKIDLHPHNG